VELADGTVLKSKGRQLVKNGQRLRLSLPGGGGYGDPKDRPRAMVGDDIRAGYISAEQAHAGYGYEEKDENQ